MLFQNLPCLAWFPARPSLCKHPKFSRLRPNAESLSPAVASVCCFSGELTPRPSQEQDRKTECYSLSKIKLFLLMWWRKYLNLLVFLHIIKGLQNSEVEWMNKFYFTSRSIYFQAHCETVRADVQIELGPNGGVNHRGMPRLGWPGTGDWWADLA